jgi:hypothetical protein
LVALATALSLVAVVVVGYARAATVTDTWGARIGGSAANGTAVLHTFSSGTGSLRVSLKRLLRNTSYSEAIHRGTCSSLSTKLVALPSIRTTATGAVGRTNTLSASQVAALRRSSTLVLRFAAGRSILCAPLIATRPSVAATPPTTSRPTAAVPLFDFTHRAGQPASESHVFVAPTGWHVDYSYDCSDAGSAQGFLLQLRGNGWTTVVDERAQSGQGRTSFRGQSGTVSVDVVSECRYSLRAETDPS